MVSQEERKRTEGLNSESFESGNHLEKERGQSSPDKNGNFECPGNEADGVKNEEIETKVVLKIKSDEKMKEKRAPVVKIRISATKSLKAVKAIYSKKLQLNNKNLMLSSNGKVVDDELTVWQHCGRHAVGIRLGVIRCVQVDVNERLR